MTDPATQARNRYFIMAGIRILATAGAVFAVVLAARAPTWPLQALAGAIILSAIYMGWAVPAALAHRWRTPGEDSKPKPTKTRR